MKIDEIVKYIYRSLITKYFQNKPYVYVYCMDFITNWLALLLYK